MVTSSRERGAHAAPQARQTAKLKPRCIILTSPTKEIEMSEALESVLHETRVFAPPAEFVARARLNEERLNALYQRFDADFEGTWADLARTEIDWHKPFGTTPACSAQSSQSSIIGASSTWVKRFASGAGMA